MRGVTQRAEGMVRKLLLVVLIAALVACASHQVSQSEGSPQPAAGGSENAKQKGAQEAPEIVADNDPVEALRGSQLFLNFPHGTVCYEQDGQVKSYDLADVTPTTRGMGKAFLAGFAFGLAGLAVMPAINAANTNALKSDEAGGFISLFPDKKSFFLSSPLSEKSVQVDLQGKRIKKFRFGGCDPEVQPDGTTVLISSVRGTSEPRITKMDLASQKPLPFDLAGSLPQSWPRMSPDGKSLLFVEGSLPDQTAIILYDLATKARRTLVDRAKRPVHPAWSPDGAFIVYASLADEQIHQLTLLDEKDEALTTTPLFKLYPAVTPDGLAVLFSQSQAGVRNDSIGGRFILKWLALEKRTLRTLPSSGHPHYFSALQAIPW